MKLCGAIHPWTAAEADLLEKISGLYPSFDIADRYNTRAKRRGLPKRTKNAVLAQMQRMGCSTIATEDNWSIANLARLLGIPNERVRSWLMGSSCNGRRAGGILPYRKAKRIVAISKLDFRKFAIDYPGRLRGIDAEHLLYVLGERDLVTRIINMGYPTGGYKHRIKNLESGEIFNSARAAGRSLHMDGSHILRQTKLGKKAYGVQFEIVSVASQEK